MTIHQKHHLLLMRHGKSDWHSGVKADFDRPLTRRGNGDVLRIADWLAVHGPIPDLIVASPARRTRETAELLVTGLQLNRDMIRWDRDIYEAPTDRLLGLLGKYMMNGRCLLLIGHNPGLDGLVCALADSEPARTASGKLMTTAALAILAGGDPAQGPQRHSMQLLQIIRPKQLED